MNQNERDNQVKIIKEMFGERDANLMEIQNFFKEYFNPKIVHIGSKATYDLKSLFFISPKFKKKFKNDPIQPITITYIRKDVIFFTWDKHPEWGEEYTMYSADWSKWLYLDTILQDELWKNKEYLKEKDYDEWYIQINSCQFTSKYTKMINNIPMSK